MKNISQKTDNAAVHYIFALVLCLGEQSVWKTLNPLPPSPHRSRLDTKLQRFHDNVNEIDDEIERFREERRRNLIHERKSFIQPPIPEQLPKKETIKECKRISPLPKMSIIPPIKKSQNESVLPQTVTISNNHEVLNIDGKSDIKEIPWSKNRLFKGPMENLYFPFGSPGGGAPNRDSNGQILTKVPGNQSLQMNKEEVKKKINKTTAYDKELKNEIIEQHLIKLKNKQEVRAPFGDLAEVIEHGKVGRLQYDDSSRPQLDKEHLPGDIFDSNVHHCKSDNRVTAYAASLDNATKFYKRMQNLEKLREYQEELDHNANAHLVFGKPGAGAPNPPGTRVRGGIEKAFFEPSTSLESKNSPLLVVSPDEKNSYYGIRSWHQNSYDYPDQDDLYYSKVSAQVDAPWERRQY